MPSFPGTWADTPGPRFLPRLSAGTALALALTLTTCRHPSSRPRSVKMHKCYETDKILYLVLELLTGGELFDKIIAKGHYSEADALAVTRTLLESIKYLHSRGVAHRDLKPENILLKDKSNSSAIKITDFGLSKIYSDDAAGEVTMKTACGTPGYVAPEVLGHDTYSNQVDLWSIGVIVYILLCGFPPFYGDNDAQMFKRIKAGQYKFLSPYWDPISADAKDFVRNLLVVDPRKRMTAAEALNHKWMGRTTKASTKNLFAKDGAAAKTEAASPEGKRTGSAISGGKGDEADPAGIKVQMVQYNIDRKVNLPAKLMKAFNLPQGTQRVGKYACSLGNSYGQLHVTTGHLCFVGAFGKHKCVPLAEVMELKPTKRFLITPGAGHSLHVKATSATLTLNGIGERDACLELIKTQSIANGAKPTVVTK